MSPIRCVPILALLAASAAAPAQTSFIPLGDLPGGDPFSQGWAISRDGLVAVGASASTQSNFQDDAFRFALPAGPMATLTTNPLDNDLPGGTYKSTAFGVSSDGAFVVGNSMYNGVRTHAFVWSGASPASLQDLGNIANQTPPIPATSDISTALGVSADGNVIVGRGFNTANAAGEACVWRNRQPGAQGLGDLPGGTFLSVANAVSADGSVIVGEGQSASGREAFRWTQATGMVGLGDDAGGAFDSAARAASGDGRVIVGYCTTAAGQEAARWLAPTYTVRALGDLPGGTVASEANGVSDTGLVIVGTGDAGRRVEIAPGLFVGATDAFVWDVRHGLRKLADVLGTALPVGWTLDEANGVSGDGTTIVGAGTNPAGDTEAYVAVLPRFCAADINESGSVTVQDIFDFLAAYFSNAAAADVNGDGNVSVQDIFDFLTFYFAGC